MENLTTQLGELIMAVQRSDVKQVRRLVAAHVSPNKIHTDGKSALMVASRIGHPEILRLLCTAAAIFPEPAKLFFDAGVASPDSKNHQAFGSLVKKPDSNQLAPADTEKAKHYSTLVHQEAEESPLTDYVSLAQGIRNPLTLTAARESPPATPAQPQKASASLPPQKMDEAQPLAAKANGQKTGNGKPDNIDIEELAIDALLHGEASKLPNLAPESSSPTPEQATEQTPEPQPPSARPAAPTLGDRTDRTNRNELETRLNPSPEDFTPIIDVTSTAGSSASPSPAAAKSNGSPTPTPAHPQNNHAPVSIGEELGAGHESKEQESPLKAAVLRNDLPTVQALLKAGVSLRPNTWYENPILVTAAELGYLEIAQALIMAGANVNNGYDHLPLHIAAEKGHLSVVQLLLNSGAYIHGTEDNGRTALIAAADGGHLPIVQYLVERGANPQAACRGETALMVAAKKNHQDVHQFLHALTSPNQGTSAHPFFTNPAGAIPQAVPTMPAQPSQPSTTPPSLVEELENHLHTLGNDPHQASQPAAGYTNGSVTAGQPSATGTVTSSAIETLIQAAATGQLVKLQTAIADIQQRKEDINQLSKTGRTALSVAIEAGHIAVVEALLDAGADPNRADLNQQTATTANRPLMVAACSQSTLHRSDLIQVLILQGANPNQVDDVGRTALMHAIDCNHFDAMAALIEAGSDLDIRDRAGHTALTQANAQQNRQAALLIQKAIEQQEKAIALLQAVTQNMVVKVQQLLQAGINPNSHTNGLSALSQAAAKGFVPIAKLLIEAGADLNYHGDAANLPPLIYAAYRGHLTMVETLLAAGANLSIQASGNLNALEYAQLGKQQRRNVGKPFDEIIELLKNQGLRPGREKHNNN